MNMQPLAAQALAEQPNRATKIIWSYDFQNMPKDPADAILQDGWDAVRLFYPKGREESFQHVVESLRSAMARRSQPCSILIDLSPRARAQVVGLKAGKEDLLVGELVTFGQEILGNTDVQIVVDDFAAFFKAGAKLYLGYGNVEFRINEVGENIVVAEVQKGGNVDKDMDLHVPATKRPDSLRDFDAIDFKLLRDLGIHHLIVSGRMRPEDIAKLKEILAQNYEYQPWLIAKIESNASYQQLNLVLPQVDGAMISRKEMSLSINPSLIPMITKEIVQRCNDEAKFVITASEMLGSMRRNPTPTRAEVSDIANVVLDGTDAVILTEEVSAGRFANQAIGMMGKIIRETEESQDQESNWIKHTPPISNEIDAISYGAYRTAYRVGAKAIVCITQMGNTALRLASFRPPVPIIAVTFSEDTLQRLSLVRGVSSILVDGEPRIEEVFSVVNERLKSGNWLKIGDRIIFVSITLSSIGQEASNLFTVQQIS